MSNLDSPGVRYLANLKLGWPELSWRRDQQERLRMALMMGGRRTHGWIRRIGPTHEPTEDWHLTSDASGGGLQLNPPSGPSFTGLQPAVGIVDTGELIMLDMSAQHQVWDASDATLTVADDGVWRTLVCYPRTRQREPGTLTLTGSSTTVTGVGTYFSRYSSATEPRKTQIRIDATDSTNGNEGVYTVETNPSDTSMTISPAPPADESGVYFRVQGDFFTATPADPDVHNNPSYYFGLVARTTAAVSGGLVVADVMRDTGVSALVQIQPRYNADLSLPRTRSVQRLNLRMAVDDVFGAPPDKEIYNGVTQLTLTDIQWISMAPVGQIAADERASMLAVVVDDVGATYDHKVIRLEAHEAPITQTGPMVNAAVTIRSSANVVYQPALVRVADSGFAHPTHRYFVADTTANTILMWTTTDAGATWSGPTTILTLPVGTDRAAGLSGLLTRRGRLYVFFIFKDGGAGTFYDLRYIYSDDLGTTWQTNSSNGFTAFSESVNKGQCSVVEDEDGYLHATAQKGAAGGYSVSYYRSNRPNDPTDWISTPVNLGYEVSTYEAYVGRLVPLGQTVAAFLGGHDYNAGAYGNDAVGSIQYLQHMDTTPGRGVLDIQDYIVYAATGYAGTLAIVGVGASLAGNIHVLYVYGGGVNDLRHLALTPADHHRPPLCV